MNTRMLALFLSILLFACNTNDKAPDVSGIKIQLQEQHFEEDFFTMDTLQLEASLAALDKKYPGFTTVFLSNILALMPQSELEDLKNFIRVYQPFYKQYAAIFNEQKKQAKEIKTGLQYVKNYFPSYVLPTKLISFIGPVNSFGCILTEDAIAVGAQLFMGKDHPIYTSAEGLAMYPAYISRKFEPAYIPVSAMNNIILDMYPEQLSGKPLIAQMIELGKRIYVLDHLLPQLSDTLITGYSDKQLEACLGNEKNIWSFFIQNDLLYKADPQLVREYISEGPFTQAFGKESPGKIGLFIGWQIVKKWMKKNSDLSFDSLMKKDPVQLFEESRYKPG
ncbi:hypothetical protein [Sediminibacterium sp.]|uniref:gliding motility lipoprotein GldB n=1 Tax=Sediminibacterium sp. TaxID=1917865 RepID=UPI003F6FFE9A